MPFRLFPAHPKSFLADRGNPSTQDDVLHTYLALPELESGNNNNDSDNFVDLPLNITEDQVEDDLLHRPLREGEDDGQERCLDLCSPWVLLNVGGLVLLTLGVVLVFVGVPLMSFLQGAAAAAARESV